MANDINRRLVFDHQLYLQQPFSLACSDLKICYDQIVCIAASLALQHIGTPIPEIIIMIYTIHHMSHTVRTAYDDYNITYGGDTIPNKFRHFIMGLFQRKQ